MLTIKFTHDEMYLTNKRNKRKEDKKMSKKFTAKLGNHKIVAVSNEHELDYPSVDIYIDDEVRGLELIASVEDNLGQLRLLAYNDLSNDDFTMSLDIKQLKEFQFSC